MRATHETAYPAGWGRNGSVSQRELPSETAVAIVINGTTQAVMMATPADLAAFGMGFALTERLIEHADQIERSEVIEHDKGVEVRLWIEEGRARLLAQRRRFMAGPTGCGLCGIESLDQAIRAVDPVGEGIVLAHQQVIDAMASLRPAQSLNAATHAVHAAGLWQESHGLLAICEDVGRHNALDKLVGTVKEQNLDASASVLLLTSRVSIEMVQKAAVLGASIMVAVSAPTALAAEVADKANLTLIGIARSDGFEIFTHARRVVGS